MKSTITVRSRGAIALGTIFAAGTAYVLLADVKAPADFTIDHLMTVLVMIGTIAAGHMFWAQAKAWRIGPAIGLAALFACGTFYCVVQSAARNAEATSARLAVVSNGNGERAKVEADLAEAKDDLRKAQDLAARECRTGNGPRCKGSEKAASMAESHYYIVQARLEKMKPALVENAGFKHAAKVFALFIPANANSIENAIVLLSPFVKAAFLEVACVIFFGIGFGHRHPVPPVSLSVPSIPANDTDPEPGSQAHVISWVREFQRRNGRKPQISELQSRFQMPKTTAWRRIKAA
jgi:hypothetical protein